MRIFLALMLLLLAPAAQANALLCEAMAAHVPESDVAHIPDDDVTMNSFEVPNTDPVRVPVDIDMAAITGGYDAYGAELKPNFGVIEVYKDGRVIYNGKDISSLASDYCDDGIIQGSSEDESTGQNIEGLN